MYSVFVLLLLLHCFIFIRVLLLCCVSRSSLYCNIPSDLCNLVSVLLLLLHCFIFIRVLLLCYVYRSSLYCNIPSDLCTLEFVLLLLLHCVIFILVLLLCCVSRSSLYCNIPSDLCSLCLSCYYFYIVLSLYLYCCYVMYPDHHFTVIYLQICVLCVCLVITFTLFNLYTCTVPMLCI